MTKRFYQDNLPRYEYLLTDMGRDFFPVLAAISPPQADRQLAARKPSRAAFSGFCVVAPSPFSSRITV
jgi:DNA-binding HxlR family transcriptional regulator